MDGLASNEIISWKASLKDWDNAIFLLKQQKCLTRFACHLKNLRSEVIWWSLPEGVLCTVVTTAWNEETHHAGLIIEEVFRLQATTTWTEKKFNFHQMKFSKG